MRRLRNGFLILSAVATGIVFCLWMVGVIGGNFREVVPGRLYRSAQLSGSNLENAIRDFRIASVVNLRGARPGESYYDSEREVCRKEGVAHMDIAMNSRHLPPPKAVSEILRAFDHLPRPILVHCEGGSDRSGLFATMYEAIVDGKPLQEAQSRDLTWRYGHLAFTRSGQLDRFFNLFRQTCGTKSLRRWAEEDYPKIYQSLGDRV